MQDHNFVKVRIERCRVGSTVNACVQVDRTVHGKLRCTPTGGGAASLNCVPTAGAYLDPDELRRAVQAATRGDWGHHLQAGAWFSAADCR